jgi:hypothetical protein
MVTSCCAFCPPTEPLRDNDTIACGNTAACCCVLSPWLVQASSAREGQPAGLEAREQVSLVDHSQYMPWSVRNTF